jgi:hypothetical protein
MSQSAARLRGALLIANGIGGWGGATFGCSGPAARKA